MDYLDEFEEELILEDEASDHEDLDIEAEEGRDDNYFRRIDEL